MVKFAEVRPGTVVQLGRFNREALRDFSHKVGIVEAKETVKIGKSVWSGITVRTGPKEVTVVQIHNIAEVLA